MTMKKIFAFLTMALLIGFIMTPDTADAQMKYEQLIEDSTMTNADTLSAVCSYTFSDNYTFSVQIVADSLTGSTAGTAYLQQWNGDPNESSPTWTTVSGKTLTINGVKSETIWEVTSATGSKYRVYIITSGTATTKVNAWMCIKR